MPDIFGWWTPQDEHQHYESGGDGYGSNEMARSQEGFRRSLGGDAETCPCRGSGHALSNLDVWARCRTHFVVGVSCPDPECTHEEEDRCCSSCLASEKERAEQSRKDAEARANAPKVIEEDLPF